MNKLRAKYNAAAAPAPVGGETFNGKSLSEIASLIAAEEARAEFGTWEAREFGADSDCDEIIYGGSAKRIAAILADAGLTGETFQELLAARTTDKWVFFGWGGISGRIIRRAYPEF